jgi:hypothetical protein
VDAQYSMPFGTTVAVICGAADGGQVPISSRRPADVLQRPRLQETIEAWFFAFCG